MINLRFDDNFTAWKVSKCGVISGLYLPVFSPNTGKYGPEITPYLNTFHTVFAVNKRIGSHWALWKTNKLIYDFPQFCPNGSFSDRGLISLVISIKFPGK